MGCASMCGRAACVRPAWLLVLVAGCWLLVPVFCFSHGLDGVEHEHHVIDVHALRVAHAHALQHAHARRQAAQACGRQSNAARSGSQWQPTRVPLGKRLLFPRQCRSQVLA